MEDVFVADCLLQLLIKQYGQKDLFQRKGDFVIAWQKWSYAGIKSVSGKKNLHNLYFISFQVLDTITSPVFLLSCMVTLLE